MRRTSSDDKCNHIHNSARCNIHLILLLKSQSDDKLALSGMIRTLRCFIKTLEHPSDDKLTITGATYGEYCCIMTPQPPIDDKLTITGTSGGEKY